MTFRPDWVLLVLTSAVLAALVVAALRRPRATPRGDRLVAWTRVCVALCLVVVALRPGGEHEVETPVVHEVDLVILLDRTASMGALDHEAGRSRMDGAAEDLVEVVSAAAGARVSVIVFDDDARLLVPQTTDSQRVVTALRTVGWRPSMKATGSDVSVAVDLAARTLTAIGEDRPGSRRVLVYVGDGEQTLDAARSSFAPLAQESDEGWVLGYGTRAGGVMPVALDDPTTVKFDGVEQRSRFDEETLKSISDELDAGYAHRTGPGGLPEIGRPGVTTAREVVPGAEYYWVAALVAVPLLWGLWITSLRRLRRTRAEFEGGRA